MQPSKPSSPRHPASRRRVLGGLAGAALLPWLPFAAARAQNAAAPAAVGAPLRVVASFSILADWVRQVGGDRVEVTSLVGPDGDAHVYSPTPADAKRVAQADLVFINGLHFEGWMDRLVHASGYRGPIVNVSEGIVPLTLDGGPDPHMWQDAGQARQAVATIRAALTRARPRDAAVFAERARQYSATLAALDTAIRTRWAGLSPAQRRAVTSHDAFGYYSRAYGVQFLAAQGWTTEKEATAAQVGRLIRQLRTQAVRAVFLENMSNPRLARQIASEAGATVGGTLYADALSPPDGPAPDYVSLMRVNTDTLVRGLTAPRP